MRYLRFVWYDRVHNNKLYGIIVYMIIDMSSQKQNTTATVTTETQRRQRWQSLVRFRPGRYGECVWRENRLHAWRGVLGKFEWVERRKWGLAEFLKPNYDKTRQS